MKRFKYIYYFALAFVVLIILLLIFSAFPIPGNYKIMVVLSGSMEPDIKTGGIVVVKPAENYKIGDVITFQRRGDKDSTTHRIVEMRVEGGKPIYTTRGDANNAPDMKEVRDSEVAGKVLISFPYLGHVVNFARKPAGFALIVLIPAIAIIYDETKKIINEVKKKRENIE